MALYVRFAAFPDIREDAVRNNRVSRPPRHRIRQACAPDRQMASDGPPKTLCGFVSLWLNLHE